MKRTTQQLRPRVPTGKTICAAAEAAAVASINSETIKNVDDLYMEHEVNPDGVTILSAKEGLEWFKMIKQRTADRSLVLKQTLRHDEIACHVPTISKAHKQKKLCKELERVIQNLHPQYQHISLYFATYANTPQELKHYARDLTNSSEQKNVAGVRSMITCVIYGPGSGHCFHATARHPIIETSDYVRICFVCNEQAVVTSGGMADFIPFLYCPVCGCYYRFPSTSQQVFFSISFFVVSFVSFSYSFKNCIQKSSPIEKCVMSRKLVDTLVRMVHAGSKAKLSARQQAEIQREARMKILDDVKVMLTDGTRSIPDNTATNQAFVQSLISMRSVEIPKEAGRLAAQAIGNPSLFGPQLNYNLARGYYSEGLGHRAHEFIVPVQREPTPIDMQQQRQQQQDGKKRQRSDDDDDDDDLDINNDYDDDSDNGEKKSKRNKRAATPDSMVSKNSEDVDRELTETRDLLLPLFRIVCDGNSGGGRVIDQHHRHKNHQR